MFLYEISKKATFTVYYVLLFQVTYIEVLNVQGHCSAHFYFGLAHVCFNNK